VKIEEPVGKARELGLIKFVKKVDVAAGGNEIAARGRAEKFEALYAVRATSAAIWS
jgi:hypothetical protein